MSGLVVDLLSRRSADAVRDALGDTRVVVVNGARQVGKSTLAQVIAREHPGCALRFLDRPDTLAAAQRDPVGFLRHDGLLLIDEVQRVPELWLAIKATVDADPRPGRFLLTGSARLLALRSLPDSLIGRAETVALWPLSQGEIGGEPDGFVDAAFDAGADLRVPDVHLERGDYLRRIERGGFPAVIERTPRRRKAFFDSYVTDLINRDVKQAAEISQAAEMHRLLRLIAPQIGGLLRPERLASRLSITAPTVARYLDILETVFLIKRVPAWTAGSAGRAVRTPKLVFVDSGIAAHLAGGPRDDATLGGLLESFVISELARQVGWSDTAADLLHFRDRDGYEVDAVLESRSGDVVGVEVKAAESVRAEDFRGLQILRSRMGDRFRAGFVLYCGQEQLGFGDRLAALPVAALWTAAPVNPG
ncbi:MAG: ATP-binding protein [Sporichthyaceae bacterium]